MKMKPLLIACLLFCLTLAAAARAEELSTPPADLVKALNEGVTMLEKQQYKAFLARFMVPEQRAKILEQMPEDELVKGFAANKATKVLEILKAVRTQKAALSEDGTVATWTTDTPKPLVFAKIDGKWYLQN